MRAENAKVKALGYEFIKEVQEKWLARECQEGSVVEEERKTFKKAVFEYASSI